MTDIWSGTVRHTRVESAFHTFSYPLLFLRTILADSFDQVPFWPLVGVNRFAFASVWAEDHNENSFRELKAKVLACLGEKADGKFVVELWAQPRLLGVFYFNPVCIYRILKDNELIGIVLEVTNTPWGEKILYRLPFREGTKDTIAYTCLTTPSIEERPGWDETGGKDCSSDGTDWHRLRWKKAMHVSPFFGMDHEYEWMFAGPGEEDKFRVVGRNLEGEKMVIATSFSLSSVPLTLFSLLYTLFILHPLSTLLTVIGIHIEAVKLAWKGVAIVDHPDGADQPKNCCTSALASIAEALGY